MKRLGDGVMAVFDDAGQAVDAALESTRAVRAIQVHGSHEASLAAGEGDERLRSLKDWIVKVFDALPKEVVARRLARRE